MPGFGYGINYEFGLFRQTFVNGYQHEKPDHWLDEGGSPWLIERPDEAIVVPVYGAIAHTTVGGVYKPSWVDFKVIVGVPHDMPIVGYGGETVNVLRLCSRRARRTNSTSASSTPATTSRAVQQKINTEAISKILYPSDSVRPRTRAAAAAGVLPRRLLGARHRQALPARRTTRSTSSPAKVAIQMNDTHPALTVAELMRMFVDEYDLPWEQAWAIDGGDVRLHESHAAAGGAGEVAGRAAGARAAAPPADHAGDQSALPGRGRATLSGRRRRCSSASRSSTTAIAAGAHGATWPWSAAIRSTASPRCIRSW